MTLVTASSPICLTEILWRSYYQMVCHLFQLKGGNASWVMEAWALTLSWTTSAPRKHKWSQDLGSTRTHQRCWSIILTTNLESRQIRSAWRRKTSSLFKNSWKEIAKDIQESILRSYSCSISFQTSATHSILTNSTIWTETWSTRRSTSRKSTTIVS